MQAHPVPGTLQAALAMLRSRDDATRNRGVDEAVRIGAGAVPALLGLMDAEEPQPRRAAMGALAELADPRAADAFQAALDDPDPEVRALAARGLARAGHPGALDAALRTMNDAAGPNHADLPPAVLALGEAGLPAVSALLDRMEDRDPATRLGAQRALEMIVYRRHGFRPGVGFPDAGAEARARAEWKENGGYDAAAGEEARFASIERWRTWLAQQEGA